MQAPIPCPHCSEYKLYRSHTRNVFERTARRLFPAKLYRCHQCNWRGWISNRKVKKKPRLWKSILFYLMIVLICLVAAGIMKIYCF